MKFHFISGLPRSGSTLMSAILRQNPRFHAGITSPVSPLIGAMLSATSADKEHSIFLTDTHRERLLLGIFAAYYGDLPNDVVFDTHRIWCARISLISHLFPEAKVICCVRNPAWIYDSLECLVQKNLQPSKIFKFDPDTTVYQRVEQVSARNGLVGFALDALQGVCCGEHAGRILLLQYETLANNPAMAMREIYEFIGEPAFEHHFEKVEFDAHDFDRQLGTPGLHTVRGPVCYKERKSILPPALFDKHKRGFWQDHKGTLKVI